MVYCIGQNLEHDSVVLIQDGVYMPSGCAGHGIEVYDGQRAVPALKKKTTTNLRLWGCYSSIQSPLRREMQLWLREIAMI